MDGEHPNTSINVCQMWHYRLYGTASVPDEEMPVLEAAPPTAAQGGEVMESGKDYSADNYHDCVICGIAPCDCGKSQETSECAGCSFCDRDVFTASDVAFLLAELNAARAREQALAETFNERVNWIQVVEARWRSAEAREAKLREALESLIADAEYAVLNLRIIAAARAALAEGEDRFVRKLWEDTSPGPWYEQGKILTEINALIAKRVPPEDEEPSMTTAEYNAQIQRALRGEE